MRHLQDFSLFVREPERTIYHQLIHFFNTECFRYLWFIAQNSRISLSHIILGSAEESTITGEESSKSKEHQTFVNCENDEQERVNDENKDEDDDDGTQRIIALHLMPSIAYSLYF